MNRRLAILGGTPAFETPMHVGRPNLPDRETFRTYVDRIFDGRWLTNSGPLVRELEERLCEFSGVSNCIPICNGTIALELATRAVGFSGEVILPSFTFIASAHSLKWQEIEPVFCDIDESSLTIDPARIEELVTPRTTGILGVHVYGNPCDVGAIDRIASKLGLRVVYDAAHAFGNRIGGRPVGTFGSAEVFSFHATKFFSTFEGGAVATDDDDLARRIRLMMNFGFGGREKDQVDFLGTNGKMTEICAAMGLSMLDCVEDVRQINRANFDAYAAASAGIPGASLVMPPDTLTLCNWQYVILRIDEARAGLSRDDLVRVLEAENVLARRYFYPGCHRMHPYSARPVSPLLPVTDRVAREVLSLPTGQAVNCDSARMICEVIGEACRLSGEVKAVLAGPGGS